MFSFVKILHAKVEDSNDFIGRELVSVQVSR